MSDPSLARLACLALLLPVTACPSTRGRPDAAAEPSAPDAAPGEPPPPLRTECRWTVAPELCRSGTLCSSVSAGFFDCQGESVVPKPGVDGQGRPRLLLGARTYRVADFGQLVRFEGAAAQQEEVPLPWLSVSDDDWRTSALVFLPGDEPALVDGSGGIRLSRLRAQTADLLAPRDDLRRLVLDDVLPGPGGTFWFLYGESRTLAEDPADRTQSKRSLLLGRFAGDRVASPVALLEPGRMGAARLGQGVGNPVVSLIVVPDSDGALEGQSTLLGRPGEQPPLTLTGSPDRYVDSAIGLADGVLVAMKSRPDDRLTAQWASPDGTLGSPLGVFDGWGYQPEVCTKATDPSYYAADDPLRCGSKVVDQCRRLGTEIRTLPVLARGDRALFAAVIVDVDQDVIRGGQTQYNGDMPPRCGMFERVVADRNVTHLRLIEVGASASGLAVTRNADLRLPDWQRVYHFSARSTGAGAIVIVNDADQPRALAVVIAD